TRATTIPAGRSSSFPCRWEVAPPHSRSTGEMSAMRRNGCRMPALPLIAIAAMSARAAWAQQDRTPHLETINVSSEPVTGCRALTTEVGVFRDSAILDVPQTVNVVPRTVMDLQEAQGLFDALKNTAGVARSQVNGVVADNITIRGVATENRTS